MTHGRFTSLVMGMGAASLLITLTLLYRVASSWEQVPTDELARLVDVGRIVATAVLLAPGAASILACFLKGTRLRLSILAAVAGIVPVSVFVSQDLWPWSAILTPLAGTPAIALTLALGRARGGPAAILGITSWVLAFVALTSRFVFGLTAPDVLEAVTVAAAQNYGVPEIEMNEVVERLRLTMGAAETISFLVAGVIWCHGALFLSSFHERAAGPTQGPAPGSAIRRGRRSRRCRIWFRSARPPAAGS